MPRQRQWVIQNQSENVREIVWLNFPFEIVNGVVAVGMESVGWSVFLAMKQIKFSNLWNNECHFSYVYETNICIHIVSEEWGKFECEMLSSQHNLSLAYLNRIT